MIFGFFDFVIEKGYKREKVDTEAIKPAGVSTFCHVIVYLYQAMIYL